MILNGHLLLSICTFEVLFFEVQCLKKIDLKDWSSKRPKNRDVLYPVIMKPSDNLHHSETT